MLEVDSEDSLESEEDSSDKKKEHKPAVEVDIFADENHDGLQTVAVLKAGASFGELALISKQPRAATIRALKDCHFMVLE